MGRLEKEAAVGVVGIVVAMPICAYIGRYVGEGTGYIIGNVIDFIPVIKDVAPWIAEKTGLVSDVKNIADLNENLYQTTGAISGLYGGFWLPLKFLAK
jgi:hypothetical protein